MHNARPRAFHLYEIPRADPIVMSNRPLLESWDSKIHPSQVALQSYLDELELLVNSQNLPGRGLGLVLRVGSLPGGTRSGHDMDNYLFPIARRLGHARLDAAWGFKNESLSSIVVQPVHEASDWPDHGNFAEARPEGSAQSKEWKQSLQSQLAGQVEEPSLDSKAEVTIAFRIGPLRNWTTLWKPAIDAMTPILGTDDIRPFHPRDDRIQSLSLHRTIDASLGHDVHIGFWWRALEPTTLTPGAFETLARKIASERFGVRLQPGTLPSVPKKFDLVSDDETIVGDAKFYTLVRGVGTPPAKFATIAEYVWLLEKTPATVKFLIFGNDRRVPVEWLKRYGHLRGDIRFFFLDAAGQLEEL